MSFHTSYYIKPTTDNLFPSLPVQTFSLQKKCSRVSQKERKKKKEKILTGGQSCLHYSWRCTFHLEMETRLYFSYTVDYSLICAFLNNFIYNKILTYSQWCFLQEIRKPVSFRHNNILLLWCYHQWICAKIKSELKVTYYLLFKTY